MIGSQGMIGKHDWQWRLWFSAGSRMMEVGGLKINFYPEWYSKQAIHQFHLLYGDWKGSFWASASLW